jgi:isoleucyl-tRNA synthetase
LHSYIRSELNIQDLVFSGDEARCGVKYKVTADWPTLGRKLRKDLGRVRAGLESVSSVEAKEFINTGTLTVNGVELVTGDLVVTRYVDPPTSGQFATNSDNDVVLLLDIQIYQDLHEQWLARELITRVQKLRKKADLQATDDVKIFFDASPVDRNALEKMINNQGEMLSRALRCTPVYSNQIPEGAALISEGQEVSGVKFMLSIVR